MTSKDPVSACHESPAVLFRQHKEIQTVQISRQIENTEISRSHFETQGRIHRIRTLQLHAYTRVLLGESSYDIGNHLHHRCFCCGDCEFARKLLCLHYFIPSTLHHLENFLGATKKRRSFFRQRNAASRSIKQNFSKFVFKVGNLSRQRGLRHVQSSGRGGKAAAPRHFHEVTELLDIHRLTSRNIYS